jgi:hypothetical protein
MKKYIAGEPFPDDFWNYDVNVITGYKVERREVNSKEIEKKYKQITQAI